MNLSNISIAALPGTGKGIILNSLIDTILGVGGKAFVLDSGRNLKKSCQLLGGRHIEFNAGHPISLNPFTHIPTGNKPDEIVFRSEMLEHLISIFQVMAAPKQGTTDLESFFLGQAIRYSWEKYQTSSNVDTVREYLISHENPVARDVGEKLSSFGEKGTFGHFFNDPADSNLKEDLIVIETEPLRSYPALLAVVVQMLIYQINQQMTKGCRTKPYIIIDEAWLLLGGKNTTSFMDFGLRVMRKYRGAIICVNQCFTDYFRTESPGATEAINYSTWKCILRQKPPHRPEVVICGSEVHGISLAPDSAARLLFSTNPQEHQIIENLIKQGFSIKNAIEELIKMQEGGPVHG
jgi:conjugal transfer ATP-binding protein TraC